jgi:hypothetical protein
MTSIIAVTQVAAVLTTAILATICMVCSYKNSMPFKRDWPRPVVGDSTSISESYQPVNSRA